MSISLITLSIMCQPLLICLVALYSITANAIPRPGVLGFDKPVMAYSFGETSDLERWGDLAPTDDAPNSLWQINSPGLNDPSDPIIPPSTGQTSTDQILYSDRPIPFERISPSVLDRIPEISSSQVDLQSACAQYPSATFDPGKRAKRGEDVCKPSKPKCEEHWYALCCYGNPLADEGGLTAGCVLCMTHLIPPPFL